jgi:ATP-dependent DNA helicase DinG
VLADSEKAQIQGSYREWLAAKKLNPRHGQRHMIAEVARVLSHARFGNADRDKLVAAIEAGTGTGKTVAYLLPALVLSRAMERHLVIATATVALQEQLINKDLPDLLANAGLEFDYALVKGRGRYVCHAKLVSFVEDFAEPSLSLGLYPDEQMPLLSGEAQRLYVEMMQALETRSWDGDRDNWESIIDSRVWSPLTSDHMQCTGRKCAYVKQCAYFNARDQLEGVDCIVANHDLVLSDLSLGGGVILPAPEETLYIFDEAHQLADKAQQHFGHRLRLGATLRWLEQIEKGLPALAKVVAEDDLCASTLQRLAPLLAQLQEHLRDVQEICRELIAQARPGDGDTQVRFALGELPPPLAEQGQAMAFCSAGLDQLLATLTGRLDDAMKGEISAISMDDAEQWYIALGQMKGRVRAIRGIGDAYSAACADPELPFARWISGREFSTGTELEMAALPVLPRRLLQDMLWNRCGAAILTSASLTALGSFDRLFEQTGVPEHSRCLQLPSPFNYQDSAQLVVPPQALDPTDKERYTAMLIEQMPSVETVGEGTLVLFTARRQMQAVYAGIPEVLRRKVLNQDELGKQEIIRRHRAAIDEGHSSIIFGLASFAEGIDLPGKYCTHVVITRLPFAVPDDPLEATLAEWVRSRGGQPFRDIALPDAARRLMQATGRLLRTEQDTGQITVFDRRIISKQYGRALLESLPDYRLVSG